MPSASHFSRCAFPLFMPCSAWCLVLAPPRWQAGGAERLCAMLRRHGACANLAADACRAFAGLAAGAAERHEPARNLLRRCGVPEPPRICPSARLPICPSVHVLRARVCACVHLCICASVHLCICASVRVCVFACLHVRVHRCGLLELLCEAMARHPQQAALQADCVLLVAGAVCAVYTLCAACGKDVHYLSVLGLMCTDIEC